MGGQTVGLFMTKNEHQKWAPLAIVMMHLPKLRHFYPTLNNLN
jgi:hypothetical protein